MCSELLGAVEILHMSVMLSHQCCRVSCWLFTCLDLVSLVGRC